MYKSGGKSKDIYKERECHSSQTSQERNFSPVGIGTKKRKSPDKSVKHNDNFNLKQEKVNSISNVNDKNQNPKNSGKLHKSHKKNAYSMPFHDPTNQQIQNLNLPINLEKNGQKKATMTPDISVHNSIYNKSIKPGQSHVDFDADTSQISVVKVNEDQIDNM